MEREELIDLFTRFLDDTGMWFNFSSWLYEIENKKPTDIGFETDD